VGLFQTRSFEGRVFLLLSGLLCWESIFVEECVADLGSYECGFFLCVISGPRQYPYFG
jgi:hypothetical protein